MHLTKIILAVLFLSSCAAGQYDRSENIIGGLINNKKCAFTFDKDEIVADIDLEFYLGETEIKPFEFFANFPDYQRFKHALSTLETDNVSRRWIQLSRSQEVRDTWGVYYFSFAEADCKSDFIKIERYNGKTKIKSGRGVFRNCALPEYFTAPTHFANGENGTESSIILAHASSLYLNWGAVGAYSCGRRVQRSSNMSWLTELENGSFFEHD